MTTPLLYERKGEWLYRVFQLETGNRIRLQARNIHKERTGIHAKVEVAINDDLLASDLFNVERDNERLRLANSSTRLLPELDKACWPDEKMKHQLDIFCRGLWDEVCGDTRVELLTPSPENTVVKLCGSYMLKGGGSIIFAPPGRGKSYTALAMIVSMDAGCDRIWPVRQTRCLYVNLERSRDSTRFRLNCINEALGLERDRPMHFLNARGRSLSDVYDSLRRDIDRLGIEAVMLDSLSRAGMGDLKEDTTGNRGIDALNSLCDTWGALGHTPRSDEKHIFGSQMWDAGMDVGVQLLTDRKEDLLGVGLQVTKANDISIPPLQVIAFEWHGDRLCSIRPGRAGEFPEIGSGKKQGRLETLKEYLLLRGKASAVEIHAETGIHRTDVWRIAKEDPTIQREQEGRSFLYYIGGLV